MFKKLISLLFIALLLVGCGSKGETSEKKVLNIFNAGEYIDTNLISKFEKEYNVKVNYSTFASNEEAYTKLLGNVTYDVIIPSDYMIEKLVEEKLVKELDMSRIDTTGLYDGLTSYFDANLQKYAVPYFWGNVGIVYDATVIDQNDVESQGWDVLRNTKYAGLMYMYDSARDSYMVALKNLGYSMNTTNLDEIAEATEWLKVLGETMEPAYVTDEAIDGLATASEGKYMGYMYSGDAAYILSENENMKFWAPEEGTNIWVDGMVISANCQNEDDAYNFINFMLEYDNAYDNSSEVGYASPLADVLTDMTGEDGDYADNEAYFPRSNNAKDEVFHNNEDVRALLTENWKHLVAEGSN